MADFDIEFDKVIAAEGVYGNDSDDSGKETCYGISRVYNSSWDGWTIIDDIKKKYGTKNITSRIKANNKILKYAKSLYKSNYWDILELDDIPSQAISHQLFDMCVNAGKTAAVRLAQRVIGMTVTGKWSEELKYNLMKYGSTNSNI